MHATYALLWIEGPLQSWGSQSVMYQRLTEPFPTFSGILGMVFNMSGFDEDQTERLQCFQSCRCHVDIYRHSRALAGSQRLRDYQVIGAVSGSQKRASKDSKLWYDKLQPRNADGGKVAAKISMKDYLQDSAYAVILELPEELTEELVGYLQKPVRQPFFGRKCCAPSSLIFRGVFDTPTEASEAGMKIAGMQWRPHARVEHIDSVTEAVGDAFELNDVPTQFGRLKKYRSRVVDVRRS